MKINIHAGHNPSGEIGSGAVGMLDESVENRAIKDKVIHQLSVLGHTVYDCTCDNGVSQADVLRKIVTKCNSHDVDLDISIHLNAGGGNGVECWTYSADGNATANSFAEKIVKEISALGFKNRGVKHSKELYVLRETKAPAILIECCFVDSSVDYAIYNADKMADAIVLALAGTLYQDTPAPANPTNKIDSAKAFDKNIAGTYKTTANLHLRVGAGTNKESICIMPAGCNVRCYGYYTAVGGVKWYAVEYSGKTGFCSSEYLR